MIRLVKSKGRVLVETEPDLEFIQDYRACRWCRRGPIGIKKPRIPALLIEAPLRSGIFPGQQLAHQSCVAVFSRLAQPFLKSAFVVLPPDVCPLAEPQCRCRVKCQSEK